MPTDESLRALREASPRSQPGFGTWIEHFDVLRDQIPAIAIPSRRGSGSGKRRRLIGLSAAAAAVSAVAAVVALLLSAVTPPSAHASVYASARKAVAATAKAGSGTMTMTVTHDGVSDTLGTTRWNGRDIALSSGPRGGLGPYQQHFLLIGGGAYLQQADGTWLRYPSASAIGPKLGPAVQLAEDNVAGNGAGQILALATGLRQARQPDGVTVYTGTIPDSSTDPGSSPADDAILQMIISLRAGNEPGAPRGSHPDLTLRLTAGSGGRVQQVSLTFQQHGSGSPAGDGTYTWSITYSQLGTTPLITVPATATPA